MRMLRLKDVIYSYMLSVKSALKSTLILLVVVLISFLVIRDMNDNRPIQFESYKQHEAFKNAIQERFPLGSNIDDAIEVMVRSGIDEIRFHFVKNGVLKGPDKLSQDTWTRAEGAYYEVFCFYETSIMSMSMGAEYVVQLAADQERRLIHVYGYRKPYFSWQK